MITLVERFKDTLDDLELPETDLVGAVTAAIEPEADRVKLPSRRWLIGAIAAFLVIGSVSIAPVRDAVGQWFGIGATQVIVEPGPDASDLLSAAEPLSGVETLGGLPVSSVQNPLPQFERPAAVLDHSDVRGRSFVWAASAERPAIGASEVGVILYVRPIEGVIEGKILPVEGVIVETVQVEARGGAVPGLWIDGVHTSTRAGSGRALVADRVLLWTVGSVQYRLEADLDLDQMTEIAESVEGGTNLLPPG